MKALTVITFAILATKISLSGAIDNKESDRQYSVDELLEEVGGHGHQMDKSVKEKRCNEFDTILGAKVPRFSLPSIIIRRDVHETMKKKNCEHCKNLCKVSGNCEFCEPFCNETPSDNIVGLSSRLSDKNGLTESEDRYYTIGSFGPGPIQNLFLRMLNLPNKVNPDRLVVLARTKSKMQKGETSPVIIDTAHVFTTNDGRPAELELELHGVKNGNGDIGGLTARLNKELDAAIETKKKMVGDSQLTPDEIDKIIDHAVSQQTNQIANTNQVVGSPSSFDSPQENNNNQLFQDLRPKNSFDDVEEDPDSQHRIASSSMSQGSSEERRASENGQDERVGDILESEDDTTGFKKKKKKHKKHFDGEEEKVGESQGDDIEDHKKHLETVGDVQETDGNTDAFFLSKLKKKGKKKHGFEKEDDDDNVGDPLMQEDDEELFYKRLNKTKGVDKAKEIVGAVMPDLQNEKDIANLPKNDSIVDFTKITKKQENEETKPGIMNRNQIETSSIPTENKNHPTESTSTAIPKEDDEHVGCFLGGGFGGPYAGYGGYGYGYGFPHYDYHDHHHYHHHDFHHHGHHGHHHHHHHGHYYRTADAEDGSEETSTDPGQINKELRPTIMTNNPNEDLPNGNVNMDNIEIQSGENDGLPRITENINRVISPDSTNFNIPRMPNDQQTMNEDGIDLPNIPKLIGDEEMPTIPTIEGQNEEDTNGDVVGTFKKFGKKGFKKFKKFNKKGHGQNYYRMSSVNDDNDPTDLQPRTNSNGYQNFVDIPENRPPSSEIQSEIYENGQPPKQSNEYEPYQSAIPSESYNMPQSNYQPSGIPAAQILDGSKSLIPSNDYKLSESSYQNPGYKSPTISEGYQTPELNYQSPAQTTNSYEPLSNSGIASITSYELPGSYKAPEPMLDQTAESSHKQPEGYIPQQPGIYPQMQGYYNTPNQQSGYQSIEPSGYSNQQQSAYANQQPTVYKPISEITSYDQPKRFKLKPNPYQQPESYQPSSNIGIKGYEDEPASFQQPSTYKGSEEYKQELNQYQQAGGLNPTSYDASEEPEYTSGLKGYGQPVPYRPPSGVYYPQPTTVTDNYQQPEQGEYKPSKVYEQSEKPSDSYYQKPISYQPPSEYQQPGFYSYHQPPIKPMGIYQPEAEETSNDDELPLNSLLDSNMAFNGRKLDQILGSGNPKSSPKSELDKEDTSKLHTSKIQQARIDEKSDMDKSKVVADKDGKELHLNGKSTSEINPESNVDSKTFVSSSPKPHQQSIDSLEDASNESALRKLAERTNASKYPEPILGVKLTTEEPSTPADESWYKQEYHKLKHWIENKFSNQENGGKNLVNKFTDIIKKDLAEGVNMTNSTSEAVEAKISKLIQENLGGEGLKEPEIVKKLDNIESLIETTPNSTKEKVGQSQILLDNSDGLIGNPEPTTEEFPDSTVGCSLEELFGKDEDDDGYGNKKKDKKDKFGKLDKLKDKFDKKDTFDKFDKFGKFEDKFENDYQPNQYYGNYGNYGNQPMPYIIPVDDGYRNAKSSASPILKDLDKLLNPQAHRSNSGHPNTLPHIPDLIKNLEKMRLNIPTLSPLTPIRTTTQKVEEFEDAHIDNGMNDINEFIPQDQNQNEFVPEFIPENRNGFIPEYQNTLVPQNPAPNFIPNQNFRNNPQFAPQPPPFQNQFVGMQNPQDLTHLGRIVPQSSVPLNIHSRDVSDQLNHSSMFFIGDGIKIPIHLKKRDDGTLHLSVDMQKLCKCDKTDCNNPDCKGENEKIPGVKKRSPTYYHQSSMPNEGIPHSIRNNPDMIMYKPENSPNEPNNLDRYNNRGNLQNINNFKNNDRDSFNQNIAKQILPNAFNQNMNDYPVNFNRQKNQNNADDNHINNFASLIQKNLDRFNEYLQSNPNTFNEYFQNNPDGFHQYIQANLDKLNQNLLESENKMMQEDNSRNKINNIPSSINVQSRDKLDRYSKLNYNKMTDSRFGNELKEDSSENDYVVPVRSFHKTDLRSKMDLLSKNINKYYENEENTLDVPENPDFKEPVKKRVGLLTNVLSWMKDLAIDENKH